MKNCIVMGAGRSGTSLMAGILSDSGYYLGPCLHEATPSNPRGYFESSVVNELNEQLMIPMVGWRPQLRLSPERDLFAVRASRVVPRLRSIPAHGQRWLARVPADARPAVPSCDQAWLMREITRGTPWCLKDPRFTFTLSAWLKCIDSEPVSICMVRHPLAVARSMVKDAGSAPYLRNLRVTQGMTLRSWVDTYEYLLANPVGTPMIFVRYEDLLTGAVTDKVSALLETALSTTFVDKGLARNEATGVLPTRAAQLYSELCRRASTGCT